MNEKILTIIPARKGSKGIKNKNIQIINKLRLIEYSIKTALKVNLPGEICITSNDKKVHRIAKNYNLKIPFIRPEKISKDSTPMHKVIFHALDFYKRKYNFDPKYFLLLQPTSPFRNNSEIKKILLKFINSKKKSLVSVSKVNHHPCEYLMYNKSKKLKYILKNKYNRRQEFPDVYFINGSIYMCNTKYFVQTKKFINSSSFLYIQDYKSSIDIDNMENLDYARFYIQKYGYKS